MSKWDKQFEPVMATGREIRDGQRVLGNAVIDVIEKGGSLLGEASTGTGKSLATAIPIIHAIQDAKKKKKTFRGVISTETLTLQTQIFEKDLPELHKIYGGFTYRKLMGRSNYLCLNIADGNKIGAKGLDKLVEKLKMRQSNLGDGEKKDVERVLGRTLSPEEWAKIAGSSNFCADNQCSPEVCYSTLARKKAIVADLVVVNHALIATDVEMKLNGTTEDGILGQIDVLVIDEGHQLEPVLVSQWTKELTSWELSSLSGSVTTGIDTAKKIVSNESIGRIAQNALDELDDLLKNIQTFYSLLVERDGSSWRGSSSALSMKYLSGNVSPQILRAMNEYEEENPIRLEHAETVLTKVVEYLGIAMAKAKDQQIKGMRKAGKGLRAAKDLLDTVRIISKALETKDGIISQYGTYGAIVDGWERRDGTYGMTLRMVPLDVSPRAKAIWQGVRTSILISATLTDLTDGSFRYARECVGFPAGKEVRVGTPFSLQTQQLVYVTPANRERIEDIPNSQFSFSELVDLLNVSRGRALVLFTSRAELDWAARELLQLRNLGMFNYPVLIQEKDSNKDKLMADFKSNIDSVLLATKSFFTGFDAAGETLSLVVICKFPLPRYSVECRQQITHWRMRGFPRWYERESLTVLQQAAGRLIRSSGCKGVVALLDHRLADEKSNIYKTARLGVDSLGSPVTLDMGKVKQFLT